MRHISVAHSPDADDIFMYYAVKFGWVDLEGFSFDNVALDIQTLNEKALTGSYDICAISFALYPLIASEYALLSTAGSFGLGYGPKLIRRKDKPFKPYAKVALSGEHTTNAMLFRVKYPNCKIIYMNFMAIQQAVLAGEVDAGVLIHEDILTFDESLTVELELFDLWLDLAKQELPLPLGGMGLKRSIPLNVAIDLQETLSKAIQVARSRQKLLCQMLLERQLLRVQDQTLEQYLSMYANEQSQSFDESSIQALNKLFALGYEHGFYEHLIRVQDHDIPIQYKQLRHQS